MEIKENFKRADGLVLAIIWSWLIFQTILLGGGIMAGDEFFSFILIHDPSVSHTLHALGDQADGGPPAYYLTAKIWSSIFSDGPLSLRLFSTTGFCVGLTTLWLLLRQRFNLWPTAFAFAAVLGGSRVMASESLEIRFYGMLFALISCAAFLGVQFCRSDSPGRGLLVANLLTQAVLVLCHPLGGFYGFAIMIGVACSDLLHKPVRIRPFVIGSYFFGWLAILLWIKQFFRQADINNPHSWVPQPTFGDLLAEFKTESNLYPLFLFYICLYLLFLFISRFYPFRAVAPADQPSPFPREYLFIGLALISINPLFWMISRLNPDNSIFLGRYLIGTSIGWTILLVPFADFVFQRINLRSSIVLIAFCALFTLFVSRPIWIQPIKRLVKGSVEDPRQYLMGGSDRAFGYKELPIVCPDAFEFMPRQYYSPDSDRYYLLVDWKATMAAKTPFPGCYKIPSALKRNYPNLHIEEASDFLRDHPKFLLLDIPYYDWPSLFLKPGAYMITRLEPVYPLDYAHDGDGPLLLVEKRQP